MITERLQERFEIFETPMSEKTYPIHCQSLPISNRADALVVRDITDGADT
jgi:hypothetical protein